MGLIGQEVAGEYSTYHFDLRGSTVAITDVSGKVTDRYQYSAYGELLSSTGDTDTPFLFNGRDGVVTDANGLYYMRARYYNPEIRRFVSQDTLLGVVIDGQSLNRYAYVGGNPVGFVDPLGLARDGSQYKHDTNDYEKIFYNEFEGPNASVNLIDRKLEAYLLSGEVGVGKATPRFKNGNINVTVLALEADVGAKIDFNNMRKSKLGVYGNTYLARVGGEAKIPLPFTDKKLVIGGAADMVSIGGGLKVDLKQMRVTAGVHFGVGGDITIGLQD